MEVVASLSEGRTAAAQCGLFTHKSVPVIFEPLCIFLLYGISLINRLGCIPTTMFYRLLSVEQLSTCNLVRRYPGTDPGFVCLEACTNFGALFKKKKTN